jgi:hypothetical protein
MEPCEVDLSLVAGTAGTFAVTYSPPRRDWLICRFRRTNGDQTGWLWVDSAPTEEGARKLAYATYVHDLARGATR